jgi:hypothetical protein
MMGKRNGPSLSNKNKCNKSLNQSYRRKQLQNIEEENAKMLKRLQEKKSSYATEKLRKDWVENKDIIRKMSNLPFHINKRSVSKGSRFSHTTNNFY